MMEIIVRDEFGEYTLPAQDKKVISKYIKRKRKERGMTLQAMADRIGVQRQAIWSWEQGKIVPTVDHLCKLVYLLESPGAQEDQALQNIEEAESILGV